MTAHLAEPPPPPPSIVCVCFFTLCGAAERRYYALNDEDGNSSDEDLLGTSSEVSLATSAANHLVSARRFHKLVNSTRLGCNAIALRYLMARSDAGRLILVERCR